MLGVDIVKISRFKDKEFYKRIFSTLEVEIAKDLKEPSNYFAKRFAAKEALVKALNDKSLEFRSISILNKEDGSPYFKEYPDIKLSLSDDGDYAIAVVLKI